MGLGSTAKKLQNLVDTAEDLYQRMNDLRERLVRMETTVDETHERVDAIEREVAETRVVIEAIAEDQGIDVEELIADTDIESMTTTVEDGESDADNNS